jgi:hypothetical protein
MRIDTSGNVGIGVTPQTDWTSTITALQIGPQSVFRASATEFTDATFMGTNVKQVSGTNKYIETGPATEYYQQNGLHFWNYAASGTAGNTISFSEAMRIDSSGNVGIGNSSPSSMYSTTNNLVIGDSGNSGITIKSTGGIGAISFADGVSGSQRYRGQIAYSHSGDSLRFNTAAGERMRIGSDGSAYWNTTVTTGYGQTTGDGNFAYANDDGSVQGSLLLVNNANRGWANAYWNKVAYTSGLDTRYFQFSVNGVAKGSINCNSAGTGVEYNTSSDRRLKENIQDLTNGIEAVKQLRPRTFDWITDEDNTFPSHGFIADEADDIVPELVNGEANAVDEDGNPVYQNMEYSKLVPLLTAALQEAITKIETLEARITALENA